MTKEEQNQTESDCLRCYEQGYEQGKKDAIEKACLWLKENACFNKEHGQWVLNIDDFRKAMEE